MSKRFRRFFLTISAFGYAFLGGGHSLWALGLQAPAAQCSMAGCHCEMMRHGGICTCAISRALLKKYPALAALGQTGPVGHCEMRSAPLQPEEASDGVNSLPSQQAHTLPATLSLLALVTAPGALFPASAPLSGHPGPPTPIPD